MLFEVGSHHSFINKKQQKRYRVTGHNFVNFPTFMKYIIALKIWLFAQ